MAALPERYGPGADQASGLIANSSLSVPQGWSEFRDLMDTSQQSGLSIIALEQQQHAGGHPAQDQKSDALSLQAQPLREFAPVPGSQPSQEKPH